MKLKTIFLALLWLTTLAAHAATDGQGKMEAMRGKVPGSYNFWIFTPIVKSSLVATQSVSFRSESNRCSVPQRHSILSASSFACSMILLALGLYWGSFVSAAAVLP